MFKMVSRFGISTRAFSVALGVLAAAAAQTVALAASTLNISGYTAYVDVPNDGGGVNITADYDYNPETTCCPPENIRWFQRITLSGAGLPAAGFPEFKGQNQFIDPLPGQGIGGGNVGDNRPFYDITSNNGTFTAPYGGGAGRFFGDRPFLLADNAPISFRAETFLVCEEGNTIELIAGFTWGFDLTTPGVPPNQTIRSTRIDAQPITDLAGIRDSLNTTLQAKDKDGNRFFPGWSISDEICGEPFTYTNIPEPSSLCFLSGLPVLLIRRRVA